MVRYWFQNIEPESVIVFDLGREYALILHRFHKLEARQHVLRICILIAVHQ